MRFFRSLWHWITSICHGLYATAAPPDGEIVCGGNITSEFIVVERTDVNTWKFLRTVRWGGSPDDLERSINRANPRAHILRESEVVVFNSQEEAA